MAPPPTEPFLKFPPGFLWGTATASYQIEGGITNNWTKGGIDAGQAVDGYHRYADDYDQAKRMHTNTYRMSVEWSRIEPERGQISRAALDYYRRVLQTCRDHGLAPVVTMSHYTVPRWHAAAGGFKTRDGIAPFVDYCRLVAEHMGDLIAVAATFNEPNVGTLIRWTDLGAKIGPVLGAIEKAAGAACGSTTWSSPMLGSGNPVQQPIQIEAAALEVRDKQKEATFSGNVKVVQGDTTMTSKILIVYYDNKNASSGADKGQSKPKSTPAQTAAMTSATPGPKCPL